MGGVVGGGGVLQDYSVSPSPSPFPLDLGFGTWILGLGFGTGLELYNKNKTPSYISSETRLWQHFTDEGGNNEDCELKYPEHQAVLRGAGTLPLGLGRVKWGLENIIPRSSFLDNCVCAPGERRTSHYRGESRTAPPPPPTGLSSSQAAAETSSLLLGKSLSSDLKSPFIATAILILYFYCLSFIICVPFFVERRD